MVDLVTVWDFYATVPHLMGFDHTLLTVCRNVFDRGLTDAHGNLVRAVLV